MVTLRCLLAIPVYALGVFMDALFFLIFFRLVSRRWRPWWLERLNSKAKPMVDWYSERIETGLGYFCSKVFPKQITLFIGMLVLMLIRFALAALFSTL